MTAELVGTVAICAGVFCLALVTDLGNLWLRAARVDRTPSMVGAGDGRGPQLSFWTVVRDEIYALGDEWASLRAILVTLLGVITWVTRALERIPLHRSRMIVGDEPAALGWHVLCALPLVLLVGRGPVDWLVWPAAAVSFLSAFASRGATLFGVWLTVALVISPGDLLLLVMVVGAGLTFVARGRTEEAALLGVCIVSVEYGLLVPALAFSALVMGPRSLGVAAWCTISIPLLRSRAIIPEPLADSNAPSLLDLAEALRSTVSAWTATVAIGPDLVPSLLWALGEPLSAFRESANAIGGAMAFVLLVVGVASLSEPLFRATAHSPIGSSVMRTALSLGLAVAAVRLVAVPGGEPVALPAFALATGLALARPWPAVARGVAMLLDAVRRFVGVLADAAAALSVVMVASYIGSFSGPSAIVVTDVVLFMAFGLASIWLGWVEHLGGPAPVLARARATRATQPA